MADTTARPERAERPVINYADERFVDPEHLTAHRERTVPGIYPTTGTHSGKTWKHLID